MATTRNVSTGEPALEGDYLVNAQGEDVVAGTRAVMPIAELAHITSRYQTGTPFTGPIGLGRNGDFVFKFIALPVGAGAAPSAVQTNRRPDSSAFRVCFIRSSGPTSSM